VTELEWLQASAARLLDWYGADGPFPAAGWSVRPSERKLRLFTCACWREMVPTMMSDSIDQAEGCADGSLLHLLGNSSSEVFVPFVLYRDAWDGARATARLAPERGDFLRDALGSPYRPVAPPVPQSPDIRPLACAAYEARSSDGTLDLLRLSVLADCLEDYGFGDVEALEHLRSAGPHYRGMWSLDLILGKS
jgi:hypothetical protein